MIQLNAPAAKYLFYKWYDNNVDNVYIKMELDRLTKIGKFDMVTKRILNKKAEDVKLEGIIEETFYGLVFWFHAVEKPHKGNVWYSLQLHKQLFNHEYVKNSESTFRLLLLILKKLGIHYSPAAEQYPQLLLSGFALSDLLLSQSE